MENDPSLSEDLRRFAAARRGRYAALGAGLCALLLFSALWRLTRGEWDIPPSRVLRLLSPRLPVGERALPEALVVRSVRLPRFCAAAGAGGLLAVSGTVLQGLLGNPLADPHTLGIASGAAFGAAAGIVAGGAAVAPAAFAGALAALALVLLVARKSGGGQTALVLSGVIVNAVLSSGVTALKAVAGDSLGAIVLWLMGSFSGASPSGAIAAWGGAFVVLLPAYICGPLLDAVSLREGQGEMLGIDERKLRFRMLCAASLGVALSVCHFGVVGFVGLVVPHIMRKLIGPRHRPLALFSFLAGAAALALADGAAQRLGELPVGAITSLVGGPFFCWIMVKRR